LISEFELDKNKDALDDFWGRRSNGPHFSRDFVIVDRQVHLTANSESILEAADHVIPLYSSAPAIKEESYRLHIISRPTPVDPGPLPDNLFDHIQYSGYAEWLTMQLGAWGHSYVDLARKQSVSVLSPRLANQPESVARHLLNTILTNYIISSGYGFLHATGLIKDGQILLFMAPHNSGKSTLALHLALSGLALMSDSMIFVGSGKTGLQLFGFPVGRIKLRQDMVHIFPQLQPFLEEEPVRGETKYRVNLSQYDASLVQKMVVWPQAVHLCLLSRSEAPDTRVNLAPLSDIRKAVMANSLFYDSTEVWNRNLAQIERLLEQARCYHFQAGTKFSGVMDAVAGLWI
jgi:hypothetical protein